MLFFNAKITIFCQPQVSVVFSCWRKLFLSINLSVSLLSLSLMREDIKYRPNSRLTLLRSVARWWTGSGVWMMIIRGIWRQMLRQISEISLHGALDEHTRELSLLCSCKNLLYRHSSHFFLWRHQHYYRRLDFLTFSRSLSQPWLDFLWCESLDYHLRWWHVEMRHKHRHLDMRHRVTTQTDQSEHSILSCDHLLTNQRSVF